MDKKFLDFLIAALLMSLAWSLRGQFGHLKGAMIPGAAAAILVAALGRDASWRTSFGRSVLLGAIGFSLGGHFGYGKLIETILALPELNQASSLLRIFLIGAIWGGLGASFLGFGFSEKPIRFSDGILLGLLGIFWFIPLGILNLEGLDLILYTAGLLILQLYNLIVKRSLSVFLFGFFGALGFGLGFLFSVILLWMGSNGLVPGPFPFWALRDQLWGFLGGMSLFFTGRILERTQSLPAPWYGFPDFEKTGYIFLTVLAPVFLTFHVVLYWIKAGAVFLAQREFITGGLGLLLFFVAAWIVWLKAKKQLICQKERVFILAALFFLWYLSLLAIAKETAVFGWGRWEAAYTIFLGSAAILTVLLPFKIYGNLTRTS